jgi:hypothetical protein
MVMRLKVIVMSVALPGVFLTGAMVDAAAAAVKSRSLTALAYWKRHADAATHANVVAINGSESF